MTQSFIDGFIKQAQATGVTPILAQQICSEYVKLADAEQELKSNVYRQRRQNINRLLLTALGAGGGALLGGVTGYGMQGDHSSLGSGALTGAGAGAALGGALGYGGGSLVNKYQDYTGVVDPWNSYSTVSPSMPGMFKNNS